MSGGGVRTAAHLGAARALEEAGIATARYVATSMGAVIAAALADGGADGPLVDVLCATCALPVYFPPVALTGRRCADGGLRGVLPLEAAARVAVEPVVAVDVGPGLDTPPGDAPRVPPVVRAHDEAMGALMAAHTAALLEVWRADPQRPRLLYVRPAVERNSTFQVDRMRQYAEDGYEAMRSHLTGTPFGSD